MNSFASFSDKKMDMINLYELSTHNILWLAHNILPLASLLFLWLLSAQYTSFIQYTFFIQADPLLKHKHESMFLSRYVCKLLLPVQEWCVLYSNKTLLFYCLCFEQIVFRFIAISRMVKRKHLPSVAYLRWFIVPPCIHPCVYLKTLFKKAQDVKQHKIYKASF